MVGAARLAMAGLLGIAPACTAAAQAPVDDAAPSPVLTCGHADGPTDSYTGWADPESGAFHFRCLVFADRTGIDFQVRYRSPRLADSTHGSVIGGGWGADFDDFVESAGPGQATIRNGADGSVDLYATRRKDAPLLVAGTTADQRARRAEACEYVEQDQIAWLRRAYCDRTIQHFGRNGRLVSYSTHAFRQVFELAWTADRLDAVTSYARDGRPTRIAFARAPRSRTVTDQDGRAVTFAFDEAGRLIRASGSTGESYSFAYAADGSLAAVGFPSGRIQTMAYDAKGRIEAIDTPGRAAVRFAYRRSSTEITAQKPEGSSERTVVKFK